MAFSGFHLGDDEEELFIAFVLLAADPPAEGRLDSLYVVEENWQTNPDFLKRHGADACAVLFTTAVNLDCDDMTRAGAVEVLGEIGVEICYPDAIEYLFQIVENDRDPCIDVRVKALMALAKYAKIQDRLKVLCLTERIVDFYAEQQPNELLEIAASVWNRLSEHRD